jgi:hypothetical protein
MQQLAKTQTPVTSAESPNTESNDAICSRCSELLCDSQHIKVHQNRRLVLDDAIVQKLAPLEAKSANRKCNKCGSVVAEMLIVNGFKFVSLMIKGVAFRRKSHDELVEPLLKFTKWSDAPIRDEINGKDLFQFVQRSMEARK